MQPSLCHEEGDLLSEQNTPEEGITHRDSERQSQETIDFFFKRKPEKKRVRKPRHHDTLGDSNPKQLSSQRKQRTKMLQQLLIDAGQRVIVFDESDR